MSDKGDALNTTNWTRVSSSSSSSSSSYFSSSFSFSSYYASSSSSSLLFEATQPATDIFNISSVVGNATETGNGSGTRPEEVAGSNVRSAFVIVACAVVILGTILGNTLICSAVAITRRLRTPSNLLIVSLAVSDLLVGVLDMPFAVMHEVTGTWSLGEVMCDFWTSIDVLFCTASILNICVISIDRYLVITKPFEYAMKRTPLRMFVMIGLVWMVSAIISIPPLFGWKEWKEWKEPPHPNECMVSQAKGYQFFATIGAFYLPLVIMVVIYSRIYLLSSRMNLSNIRQSGGSLAAFNRTASYSNGRSSNGNGHLYHLSTTPTGEPSASSLFHLLPPEGRTSDVLNRRGQPSRNGHLTALAAGSLTLAATTQLTTLTSTRKRGRTKSGSLVDGILRLNCRLKDRRGMSSRCHERKATRTLGVIMGVFVACWLPFFILALVKPFCRDPLKEDCIPQWLSSLLLWLGFTNSLLNPVIYARFNREFRIPFKYILQCRCANINSHLRSEEFTEQFGRQISRQSSVFPPPLSTPHPTSGGDVTSGRLNAFFPPLSHFIPHPVSPSCLTPSCRQGLPFAFSGPPHSTPTSQVVPSHQPSTPSPSRVVESVMENSQDYVDGCSNMRAALPSSSLRVGSDSSFDVLDGVPFETEILMVERGLTSGDADS